MKLGSTYMIQRPKNSPRNGAQQFPASKEVQDTEVIKQGVGVCLLGQRWNLLVDYLEKGATIIAKY
jgi:hypothetical protein